MRKKTYFDKRHSYFSYRPYEFIPGKTYSKKILLTEYCKQKNITTGQARNFIRKKWLAITKLNNRIWVEEICTEEIENFLS